MSATSICRPSRLATPVVGVLLAVSLLAGCGGGQRDPGGYGDGVKRDFIEGCWTTLVRDAHAEAAQAKDGTPLSASQLEKAFPADAKRYRGQCSCVYGKFEDDLPFGDFKKINEQQTEEPAKLSAKVTKLYADCKLGDPAEA